jgi:DNA modification methylase
MKPYYEDDSVTLWHGDSLAVLRELPDASVDCCVTSPPYFGLRDYGEDGQYGLEASPAEYVETMRALFAEVRRVLADDGTLWLNLGDSYASGAGGKPGKTTAFVNRTAVKEQIQAQSRGVGDRPHKNLLGIPWRVAFALQDDGWILRNDIIWAKSNAMPESVTDRLSTKHEHMFMFSKSPRYWFDLDPIREPHITGDRPILPRDFKPREGTWAAHPMGNHRSSGPEGVGRADGGRNPGDVWSIPTQPFSEAHFAVMPQALASRAIQAGCKPGGTVLDPFSGSGTTGLAAAKHGRKYVGIDLSSDYLDLSLRTRLAQSAIDFGESA